MPVYTISICSVTKKLKEYTHNYKRYEVLTVLDIEIMFLWDVTPCNLIDSVDYAVSISW
jgi:hypothetical protein